MAYCQADLYARYMSEKYGEGAPAKMLTAYADNLDTPAAIAREFGASLDDFERGYLEYVRGVAATVANPAADAGEPVAALERSHQTKPTIR